MPHSSSGVPGVKLSPSSGSRNSLRTNAVSVAISSASESSGMAVPSCLRRICLLHVHSAQGVPERDHLPPDAGRVEPPVEGLEPGLDLVVDAWLGQHPLIRGLRDV